jgi:hypothetical protein
MYKKIERDFYNATPHLLSNYSISWLCPFTMKLNFTIIVFLGARGGAVVEALRYKPEGSGFDSR